MASKRTKSDAKREAKRVKVDDDGAEYELKLSDGVYIDVDKLFKSPAFRAYFNKKYKRSVKRLIDEEELEVIYATKEGVALGELHMKTAYAPKSDLRLVKKNDDAERIIMLAKSGSHDLAPPVIEDDDLVFFVDKNGNKHQVEMRGTRTRKGIFFKAKDVARVFQSDRLVDTILDERKSYCESFHFVWFAMQNHAIRGIKQCADLSVQEHPDIPIQEQDHHSPKVRRPSREVFLTFNGLMLALNCTRTGIAKEFCDWVYDVVFAIAYGTPAQKKAMIKQLCQVDKIFLEVFLKLVPNSIACLYLVDTAKRVDGKRVFKFGRSEYLKERFFKLSAEFGEGTLLDTVVFVPQDCLSEAEALLSHSISEDLRFALDKARELLLLDSSDYKAVRKIMQTISDKYHGSLTVHTAVLKNQALKYEMRIKDLEQMIEILQERIQYAVTDEKKNTETLLLHAAAQLAEEKSNAAAQLAEEKSKTAALQHQLDAQLETQELRMKVLKLEHAAELAEKLAEKDRRIVELEETNRRLGKNFPDAG